MPRVSGVGLVAVVLSGLAFPSLGAEFRFEGVVSLGDMRDALAGLAPLGTPGAVVRARLLDEGKGTLYVHPERPSVEKYVYDINLCRLYVFRWNISANYNSGGRLTQIFVNGEPVHASGDKGLEPPTGGQPGVKQQIIKAYRPRPEADLGEKELAFILYDLDSATDRADDEFVFGAGPSRADPRNLGTLHGYSGVERWRSIFDAEKARAVVPYAGTCPR